MKRLMKTLPILILVLLCLLPLMQTKAAAAETGTCGSSITWTLDKGVLTLTGSGEMYDYTYDYGGSYSHATAKTPWAKFASQITAVKADPAITSIGGMAFFHCTKLQTVELPGVVTVGSKAFEGCSALQSVSLPAAVTVGESAFKDCYLMTDARLPAVEVMGKGAFSDCGGLLTVSAPKLKTVPENAFYDCIHLTAADVPAVETLGAKAFGNCTELQEMTLPNATVIGEGAFSNCYALHTAQLPKLTALPKDAFKNCTGLTAVSFPAVTSVARYAFLNCENLASISLPNVAAIPPYAFELLTGLRTVELPMVSFLGAYAFSGCESLESVHLPLLTQMQAHAFRLCEGLKEADLPLLTALPNYAFYQCSSLQTVNAPLLTVIGDFGFQECRSLQVADFPLVTHIGNCGFYLCTSLKEAYVPAVKTIDYNGFNTCRSLQLLSISMDLERVNARAFEACSALKSVYVSRTKTEWKPLTVEGYNNEYFLNAQAIYDAPPMYLEELPAMVSVVKGCSAELSLRAHGSGLSYSWQMCLPNSDRWIDLSPVAYPTANSPKLVYGPATEADDGLQLRCAVTNRSGDTLTSQAVTVRLTPFLDVPADAYFFTPVKWAVDKGITAGISPVMFGSDYPCTRAQVVTFLWAAAGRPAPASTVMPFGDVPADAYYRSAVLWAMEKGITAGVSPTAFGPDVTCTRGQIAAMLWRAAGSPPQFSITVPDIPIEYAAAPMGFSDVKADDYFYQAVQWAVKEEITAGTSATTFSPNAPCTRAQIVTFLYKDSL